MGKIRIQNLRFFTYNGVLPEERKLGQPIAVDLELILPLSDAGKSDDLTQTVSYAEVTEKVSTLIEEKTFLLMESVAYNILELLEENYGKILRGAKVKVRKLSVPMSGIYDHIEIEMDREWKK